MTAALYFAVFLVVLAFGYALWQTVGKTYLKYRGTRVVTCPETGKPVAVKVDAAAAAESSALGPLDVHLKSCTRWPERRNCGQECLAEIESAPGDCLLRGILQRWYSGKSCALCRKEFGEIHWHDHKPCLLTPDGVTIDWSGFAPERVFEVLQTHQPVCWDCHVAEDFRRRFPDLVVDRDWKSEPGNRVSSQAEPRETNTVH